MNEVDTHIITAGIARLVAAIKKADIKPTHKLDTHLYCRVQDAIWALSSVIFKQIRPEGHYIGRRAWLRWYIEAKANSFLYGIDHDLLIEEYLPDVNNIKYNPGALNDIEAQSRLADDAAAPFMEHLGIIILYMERDREKAQAALERAAKEREAANTKEGFG